MGKKILDCYITVRWMGLLPDETHEAVTELIRHLSSLPFGHRFAIHWNIPSYPLFERKRKSIFDILKDRAENGDDVLLPMGYSGACHSLLVTEELRREIKWSLHNSAGSGLTDRFQSISSLFFPMAPDPFRDAAIQLYEEAGITHVLWLENQGRDTLFFDVENKRISETVQTICFPSADIGKRLRTLVKSRDSRLHILLPLFPDLKSAKSYGDWLVGVLHAVERRFRIETPCMQPLSTEHAYPESSKAHQIVVPFNRTMHIDLQKISGYRSKREIQAATYRNLLQSYGPYTRSKSRRKKTTSSPAVGRERQNIAAMSGSAAIYGEGFTAHFESGRFLGLQRPGSETPLPPAADSYCRFNGEKRAYRTIGTFSIEDRNLRGLREVETLEVQGIETPGSLRIDYFCVEDYPYLFINCWSRYPGVPGLWEMERAVPLEMTLITIEKGSSLSLHSLYPDGSRSHIRPQKPPWQQNMAGGLFCADCGGVFMCLGFPPPTIGYCAFRIEENETQYRLKAAPFQLEGEWNPEETAVFSLYVGLEEQLPASLPVFSDSLLKEIPRHRIILI